MALSYHWTIEKAGRWLMTKGLAHYPGTGVFMTSAVTMAIPCFRLRSGLESTKMQARPDDLK
jgi:hypothetical protein